MSEDRIRQLESRLDQLTAEVAVLRGRLSALDGGDTQPDAAAGIFPHDAQRAIASHDASIGLLDIATLTGRSCLVLGGAYLLRSVTQRGWITPSAGVLLGLCYGILWTLLADRAARTGLRLRATIHGLVSLIIVFPLIAEAALRFRVFTPVISAGVLTLTAGLGLTVSWRRGLHIMAWLVTLASAGTSLVLLAKTEVGPPFLLHMLFLAAATLWIGYARQWRGLRWAPALMLDIAVWQVARHANLGPGHVATPHFALALQAATVALYLLSFAYRALIQGQRLRIFSFVQSALVLLIGVEGALRFAGNTAMGITYTAIALAAFAATRARPSRAARRSNHAYFTAAACVAVFEAVRLLAPTPARELIWAALALACALPVRRGATVWHTAALAMLAAAAIASPLAGRAARIWTAPASAFPALPGLAEVAILILGVAAYAGLRRRRRTVRTGSDQVIGFAVLLIAVFASTALVLRAIGEIILQVRAAALSSGVLGLLRTVVIAGAALAAGAAGRRRNLPELRGMAIFLLVAGGLKIVFEDLRVNQTSTLFLSLLVYGGALLATPRLLRPAAATASWQRRRARPARGRDSAR